MLHLFILEDEQVEAAGIPSTAPRHLSRNSISPLLYVRRPCRQTLERTARDGSVSWGDAVSTPDPHIAEGVQLRLTDRQGRERCRTLNGISENAQSHSMNGGAGDDVCSREQTQHHSTPFLVSDNPTSLVDTLCYPSVSVV